MVILNIILILIICFLIIYLVNKIINKKDIKAYDDGCIKQDLLKYLKDGL